jgi:hypothetical protein
MVLVVRPPAPLEKAPGTRSIHLSGEGTSWRAHVIAALAGAPVTIWDPDGDDPDAIAWELAAAEQADRVLVYLDPAARSPSALVTLALLARTGRAVVCCPEGFWRKGHVELVCRVYGVPTAADLDALAAAALR